MSVRYANNGPISASEIRIVVFSFRTDRSSLRPGETGTVLVVDWPFPSMSHANAPTSATHPKMDNVYCHPIELAIGTAMNIESDMPPIWPIQLVPLTSGSSFRSNHWDPIAPTSGITRPTPKANTTLQMI